MKTPVFVALNARFNHTNSAVRSLASYTYSKTKIPSVIVEKTISEPLPVILRSVCDAAGSGNTDKSVLVLFSIYIWNAPLMYELACEVKKIFPDAVLGCGGPEVSYNASFVFQKAPSFDFIVKGEGEQTLCECIRLYSSLYDENTSRVHRIELMKTLENVEGLYLQKENSQDPFFTGERELLCPLDALVFPYPSLDSKKNQNGSGAETVEEEKLGLPFSDPADPDLYIFYYESSRGCPFRCSYCLSSIDKTVRFVSLERVYKDLDIFLNAGAALVKFVDRTFNLDEQRYLSIWKYIAEHHNGKTMFHFEIAAEQFTDAVLDFLQTVGEGVMQFEVGIQTMNPKTLCQIHRPFNKEKLETIIQRIPKTIHLHLDLIAGLPHEDISSFKYSYENTIALKPDMLQLGFLKILHGTEMESYALTHKEYAWLSNPPYEVLRSPCMPYADLLFLKDIEHLTDVYYNSGNFQSLCFYLIDNDNSLFDFFSALLVYFKEHSLLDAKHTVKSYAAYLYDFLISAPEIPGENGILKELLRFEFLRMGKPGSCPPWCERHYSKDNHHKALTMHTEIKSTRESYAYSEYEEFSVNPLTYVREKTEILFLYPKPLEGVRGKTHCIML